MNMASWPSVSLSLYCSALSLVMTNSGFSASNGLPRKLFTTGAAPFFRPPVQAGMLPSALPAFSAPSGVRLVPSLAASSGETAAITLLASRVSARAPVFKIDFICCISL
ncbi:hypothetical protein D9M68_963250 [compost metagenome]